MIEAKVGDEFNLGGQTWVVTEVFEGGYKSKVKS